MRNGIQVILFDLDGVLVETRELHYLALSKALKNFDIDLTLEEHSATYDGLPTYKKVEMLAEKHSLSTDQTSLLNSQKQQYTIELLAGKIGPNKDLNELFHFLKSKGIKVAVCSNTKRSTLDFILNKLEISSFLEFSLSNEDVHNPKPDPEIYLQAMKRLNTNPVNTLIIEDSLHGLQAARASMAHVHPVANSSEVTLKILGQYCK